MAVGIGEIAGGVAVGIGEIAGGSGRRDRRDSRGERQCRVLR